jgi:5-enolpyruvylshikimate-3-phosphate synthase
MTRVADPLRRMGAQISGPNGHDGPPLSIVGSRLRGIEYRMPVPSAQVKTAILAAGLQAEGRTLIYEPVPPRSLRASIGWVRYSSDQLQQGAAPGPEVVGCRPLTW